MVRLVSQPLHQKSCLVTGKVKSYRLQASSGFVSPIAGSPMAQLLKARFINQNIPHFLNPLIHQWTVGLIPHHQPKGGATEPLDSVGWEGLAPSQVC